MGIIKSFLLSLFIKKYNSFDFPILKEEYSERIRKNIFKLTSFFLAIGIYLYGFKKFFDLEAVEIDELLFDRFMILFVSILIVGLLIHSLFRIFLYREFLKDKSLKDEEKTYPKKMQTFYKIKSILLLLSVIGLNIGVR